MPRKKKSDDDKDIKSKTAKPKKKSKEPMPVYGVMDDDDKKEKPKRKRGRPTKYSEELAEKICDLVASSTKSLDYLCANNDFMPDASQIYKWRRWYPNFHQKYLAAKSMQAELFAEETLKIADDDHNDCYVDNDGNERINTEFVQRSNIKIKTRMWHASKLAPKIYGDKNDDEAARNTRELLNQVNQIKGTINKYDKEY